MNNLAESLVDSTLPEDTELAANAAAHELCAVLSREPHRWPDVRISAEHIPPLWRESFIVLRRLHERGVEPTAALMADELVRLTGYCDGIGDRRIRHLWGISTGSSANLAEYQRVLRRVADQERLGRLIRELGPLVARGKTDEAWTTINRTLAESPGEREGRALKAVMQSVFERLEQPPEAVPLGLATLDYMLAGGLRGGEVMVLGARPGVGKSALALQVILHVAEHVGPAAIWTLEMSQEQWVRRALAALSLVNSRKFRTGKFEDAEYVRIAQAAGVLDRMPLYFADTMDTTPEAWRLEASQAVRRDAARLLVIDYLQLMQPPAGSWSRENEVAAISRTVKRTAIDLNVPVLLLAQLNREAQDRPPTLRNLRESGAVEQDADAVMFIHRDLDQDTGTHKDKGMLILAKQRDGETGIVPINFDGAYYQFTEITDREPPPDLDNRHRKAAPYADN